MKGVVLFFVFVYCLYGVYLYSERQIELKQKLDSEAKEVHLKGDVIDDSLAKYFIDADDIKVNLSSGQGVEFSINSSPTPVVLDSTLTDGLKEKFSSCKFNGWVKWEGTGSTFTINIVKAVCSYKDNSNKRAGIPLKGDVYSYLFVRDIHSLYKIANHQGEYDFFVDNSLPMFAIFNEIKEKKSWLFSSFNRLSKELGLLKSERQQRHSRLASIRAKRVHIKADFYDGKLVDEIVNCGVIKAAFSELFAFNGHADKIPVLLRLEIPKKIKILSNMKALMCFANGWAKKKSSYAKIHLDGVHCVTEKGILGIDVAGVAYHPDNRMLGVKLQRMPYRHGGMTDYFWELDKQQDIHAVFEKRERMVDVG